MTPLIYSGNTSASLITRRSCPHSPVTRHVISCTNRRHQPGTRGQVPSARASRARRLRAALLSKIDLRWSWTVFSETNMCRATSRVPAPPARWCSNSVSRGLSPHARANTDTRSPAVEGSMLTATSRSSGAWQASSSQRPVASQPRRERGDGRRRLRLRGRCRQRRPGAAQLPPRRQPGRGTSRASPSTSSSHRPDPRNPAPADTASHDAASRWSSRWRPGWRSGRGRPLPVPR